jgi:protein SCO1/2
MKLACLFMLVALALAFARAEAAPPLSAAEAARQSSFEQKLGAQIPLDAVFRDERGNAVRFGDCLKGRPVILVMGYSDCPMLCSLVLNGVVESMNDLRATAGQGFDLIDVSIDPAQSFEKAAAMKRTYFKRYARAGAQKGWHFLTGDADSIRRVTDAAGFHYVYDPASKQFAHPSGLVVLTPDGKVSRYFFGVTFDPRELQSALTKADSRGIGSAVEELLLLCFRSNAMGGKYGPLIMNAMRAGAAATLLGLGLLIYRLSRQIGAAPAPAASRH